MPQLDNTPPPHASPHPLMLPPTPSCYPNATLFFFAFLIPHKLFCMLHQCAPHATPAYFACYSCILCMLLLHTLHATPAYFACYSCILCMLLLHAAYNLTCWYLRADAAISFDSSHVREKDLSLKNIPTNPLDYSSCHCMQSWDYPTPLNWILYISTCVSTAYMGFTQCTHLNKIWHQLMLCQRIYVYFSIYVGKKKNIWRCTSCEIYDF